MKTNEQGMFGNIGEKICKFAEVWTVLGAIIFILAGIIWDITLEIFGMTILGIVMAFFNYISTWCLYAFGQITDDIHSMRNNTSTSGEVLKNKKADEYINSDVLPEL